MLKFIHRSGYSNKNYQNTSIGIDYCLQNNQNIEIDIRLTTDNHFVVFHDRINITAEVFKVKYPNHPFLCELPQIISSFQKLIYIDIKDFQFPANLLATQISSFSELVFIGSTNTRLLFQLAQLRDHLGLSYKLVQQLNHLSGYKHYVLRSRIPKPHRYIDYLHLFHEWDIALPLIRNLNQKTIQYHLQHLSQTTPIICGATNITESEVALLKLGANGCMPNHI